MSTCVIIERFSLRRFSMTSVVNPPIHPCRSEQSVGQAESTAAAAEEVEEEETAERLLSRLQRMATSKEAEVSRLRLEVERLEREREELRGQAEGAARENARYD